MDRLLPVVTALFDDLSAASWNDALNTAAPLFDAAVVHVWARDPRTNDIVLDVLNTGRDHALVAEYQTHFADQDMRLPRLTALQGVTQPCWKTVDAAEFDRTDVVRGYLDRPDVDLRWSLGTGFVLDNGVEIIAGAARGRSMGAFSLAEARLFDHLAANLRNAIDVKLKLDMARHATLPSPGADATSSLVLDLSGKVLFASPEAERMLSHPGLIRVEQGRLKMTSATSDHRLERYVASLAGRRGALEPLSWFEGEPPRRISLSLMPGPESDALTSFSQGRSAILVLIEAPAGVRPMSGLLADRGLSVAEQDVALSIIGGKSVREIALEKQRSVETIRSQLKSLMAKLGLNRQADLVRFVSGNRS